MRFKQSLGIVGAICSSLLVSYGAFAQTTNPTPGGTNPADMERICTEYMEANGLQPNRTGDTAANTGTGTTGTTTNRGTTGNTALGTTGTTGTAAGTTNRPGSTATGTAGTTTATRQGVGSFTPEQLDRMCANFMNDSDSDRTTPSATPGGTTRPNQTPTAPNRR